MGVQFIKVLESAFTPSISGEKAIIYDGTRVIGGATYYYKTKGGVTTWWDSNGNVVGTPHTITVSSNDTSKGTVSGTTEFVYFKSASAQTVTLTTTLNPIGENVFKNYTPSVGTITDTNVLNIPANTDVDINVSAVFGVKALDDYTWGEIHTIAAAGTAANYWSVGDYKNVSVASGTVDESMNPAGTYRAVILGINHNPDYENANSIDFCIGQNTNGVDIAFMDANNKGARINETNITTGGWTGSAMYTTYLPQFYNLLPSDLKSAIITPKKYTHNYTGGSGNGTEANVTLSEDSNYKLFLMAEFEIFGSRSYANSYEQNKQAQYMYYKASPGLAKSKVRYCYTSTGESCSWWDRSTYCNASDTTRFCRVTPLGGAHFCPTNYSFGFVPCFKV